MNYKLSTFPTLENYSLYEHSVTFPAILRINDVEADGFPDLLITVYILFFVWVFHSSFMINQKEIKKWYN